MKLWELLRVGATPQESTLVISGNGSGWVLEDNRHVAIFLNYADPVQNALRCWLKNSTLLVNTTPYDTSHT